MDFGFWLGIILVAIMLIGGLWERDREKREWNNGYCKKCGSEWERFDMDSQGGRGYTCDCGRTIWISYKVDK